MTHPHASTTDLFARTAVHSWKESLARLDQMFAAFSDADLQREIAPGKNRIFYLLGHLTAVHDRMLPLLGLGVRLHEELDQDFLTTSDRSGPDRVSAGALREGWAEVNVTLTRAIEALPAEDWLTKHEAVSAEDFAKEPLRNRLSVLLSRTAHVQFHTGQIRLAVKKV
jgi:DinB superfamily